MQEYSILGKLNDEQDENSYTVASCFTPSIKKTTMHQTEAELEKAFIEQLINENCYQKFEPSSMSLIDNIKIQLQKLNNRDFSFDEWEQIKNKIINPNMSIIDKNELVQNTDGRIDIRLDDGSLKNIILFDKENLLNNHLQVMNQYNNDGIKKNRYDVTILINGFPMVHCELKRRGVLLKEAFNQINRYKKDSFSSNDALFEYVQIFIISNGTETKYYSNTTNSFEFTTFWSDVQNNLIKDLEDFTKTFLLKKNVLNILFKYSVFDTENKLKIMRPYQIAATEAILNKVNLAYHQNWQGTVDAGGYIWHSTGSGKTLTSFKTARILKTKKYIDKVMFVVDRKDLDYQTIKEYDKFEKGCVSSNKSTFELTKQINNQNEKIIVTTIQKLNNFIKQNKTHDIYNKNVVFVFDECHRSQFGEAHRNIIMHFKKYFLFGFTGTPIFPDNALNGFKTTEEVFGKRLHTYTVMNAINDNNVLGFLVEQVSTIKIKDNVTDVKVKSIDTEKALIDPKRIELNSLYIIDSFNRKTKDGKFNSILACQSISMAKAYYSTLKRIIKEKDLDLKIATIYSCGANEDPDELFGDDETLEDVSKLDETSKDFLESAINDYNITFKTNFDMSANNFQLYYKDISERMRDNDKNKVKHTIDILIVVNMFLTGFDSLCLNTLWVDKNLKYHGLLQAFSRTNRINGSLKTYGNVVCFRNLSDNIAKTMQLFGDENAGGIILLKSFDAYYYGYDDKVGIKAGYYKNVENFCNKYNLSTGVNLVGNEQKKEFVNSFNDILKLSNILDSFEEFISKKWIFDLNEYTLQDYMSIYNDIKEEFKSKKDDVENVDISDDVVFETELVQRYEVDVDYILSLLKQCNGNEQKIRELEPTIKKLLTTNSELKSKKILIEAFINSIDDTSNISEEWSEFVRQSAIKELFAIIVDKNLKSKETVKNVEHCLLTHSFDITGSKLQEILNPRSWFNKNSLADNQETEIALQDFFEKYDGLVYSLKDNYV